MNKFRELRADEIETRLQSQFGHGIIVLLYKDARCDMNVLDETVGPHNWQRRHYECKGNLFCSVGIYEDARGEWVWKDDAGAESRTEKEKGEASDSFKRACTNWGIGRELYTSPFIWISLKDGAGEQNYKLKEKDGKQYFDDYLTVTEISYTDGKISGLAIQNKAGKQVFTFGGAKPAQKSSGKKGGGKLDDKPKLPVCPVCNKLVKPGNRKDGDKTIQIPPEQVLAEYGKCAACLKKEAAAGAD